MDADQIVDRRRLRRKLTFWRVVAFLLLAAAIVGTLLYAAGDSLTGPQIARVSVSGFIGEDRDQLKMLDKLAETDTVKAVLVSIDSTGGSTAGGESLYEALRRLAAKKPVVATIGTVGASAAYMTAIATDHIVARRTSITGSIGVIFEYPEVSQLLKTLGVSMEEIKSAPLKAEPSPFHPASDEAKAVIAGMITDSYNWFVDIVADRRKLARAEALRLADGRVFTGRQALDAKLIDEIGGEGEAIAWLGSAKGVDVKLPVRDWKPVRPGQGFFSADAIGLWIARQLGFGPLLLKGDVLDRVLPERLKLDGLMSVWQGPGGGDGAPAEGAAR
ncbi:MAG: signal peptide peptidase SppA [Rhizobiales bacterium]|nr:signal peptide peptidase SppA [Hyphomicrobiales bacterium]